jgi:hypothetical protein
MKALEDERKNGFSKWSWFGIIDKLAGGDPLKFDEVLDLNFEFMLQKLCFDDLKDKEIKKQQEKTNRT